MDAVKNMTPKSVKGTPKTPKSVQNYTPKLVATPKSASNILGTPKSVRSAASVKETLENELKHLRATPKSAPSAAGTPKPLARTPTQSTPHAPHNTPHTPKSAKSGNARSERLSIPNLEAINWGGAMPSFLFNAVSPLNSEDEAESDGESAVQLPSRLSTASQLSFAPSTRASFGSDFRIFEDSEVASTRGSVSARPSTPRRRSGGLSMASIASTGGVFQVPNNQKFMLIPVANTPENRALLRSARERAASRLIRKEKRKLDPDAATRKRLRAARARAQQRSELRREVAEPGGCETRETQEVPEGEWETEAWNGAWENEWGTGEQWDGDWNELGVWVPYQEAEEPKPAEKPKKARKPKAERAEAVEEEEWDGAWESEWGHEWQEGAGEWQEEAEWQEGTSDLASRASCQSVATAAEASHEDLADAVLPSYAQRARAARQRAHRKMGSNRGLRLFPALHALRGAKNARAARQRASLRSFKRKADAAREEGASIEAWRKESGCLQHISQHVRSVALDAPFSPSPFKLEPAQLSDPEAWNEAEAEWSQECVEQWQGCEAEWEDCEETPWRSVAQRAQATGLLPSGSVAQAARSVPVGTVRATQTRIVEARRRAKGRAEARAARPLRDTEVPDEAVEEVKPALEAAAKQGDAELAEAEGKTAEAEAEGKMAEAEAEGKMAEGKMAEAKMAEAEAEGKMAEAEAEAKMAEAKMAEAKMAEAKMAEAEAKKLAEAEAKKAEAEAKKAAKAAEAEAKKAAKAAEAEAKKAEAEAKKAAKAAEAEAKKAEEAQKAEPEPVEQRCAGMTKGGSQCRVVTGLHPKEGKLYCRYHK